MSASEGWVAYVTIVNYALLVVLWTTILVLYLSYRRAARAQDALVAVLASVLALDALKSVAESAYFGVLWAGEYGLAFEAATPWLSDPAVLLAPKLLNTAVAITILIVVMRRWVPAELLAQRSRIEAEATLRAELVASLDEVRAKEERWQLALRASEAGIWDYDVQSGALWISPRAEAQLGYPAGELSSLLASREWKTLVHPDDRGEVSAQADALVEGRSASVALELRAVASDGAERRISVRAVAQCDAEGRVTRIVGSNADVTARHQAEVAEAARRRTESLGMLAGGVAHDFNNLLAVVSGNAALVRSHVVDEAGKVALDDIDVAIKLATDLTTRLLAYSGRGRFVVGPLGLSGLAGEMARLLGSSAPKHVRIETALAESLLAIDADAAQIQQVLMNLITNAIEAIGSAPGVVHVRTRMETTTVPISSVVPGEPALPPGRYVVLDVEDTGVGMDAATFARIFEPFFSSKTSGRGFGLSAMLGILRAHGACLRVRTAPGAGSTFTVWFPPSSSRTVASAPRPATIPPKPAGERTRRRALVADDDSMMRRLLVRLLEKALFDVDVAHDGIAAVRMLEAQDASYAVVVLDITMPGLDGRQVLARHRAAGGALPIVLTSGYAHEGAPLDDRTVFLQKPFSPEQLHAVLAQLVA